MHTAKSSPACVYFMCSFIIFNLAWKCEKKWSCSLPRIFPFMSVFGIILTKKNTTYSASEGLCSAFLVFPGDLHANPVSFNYWNPIYRICHDFACTKRFSVCENISVICPSSSLNVKKCIYGRCAQHRFRWDILTCWVSLTFPRMISRWKHVLRPV